LKIKLEANPKIIFWFAIFLLFSVSILVRSKLPVFPVFFSPHDDELFLRMSQNISQGNWLGDFDQFTLLKLPGMGIFLSFSDFLDISFITILHVLYLCSILLFIYYFISLKMNYGSIIFIVFLLTLNPAIYGNSVSTTNRVFLPLVFSILSIALLLTLTLPKKNKFVFFFLNICLFFSVGFLTITRSDWFWILPALFVILTNHVVKSIKVKRFRFQTIFLSVVLTLSIFLPINIIKLVNYHYYGVYLAEDFSNGPVANFVTNATRLSPSESLPLRMFFGKNERNRLYSESSYFSILRDEIENKKTSTIQFDVPLQPNYLQYSTTIWFELSCTFSNYCADPESTSFFPFLIRDVVWANLSTKTPHEFYSYFEILNKDINLVCANESDCGLPSMAVGLQRLDNIPSKSKLYFRDFFTAISILIDMPFGVPATNLASEAPAQSVKLWQDVLDDNRLLVFNKNPVHYSVLSPLISWNLKLYSLALKILLAISLVHVALLSIRRKLFVNYFFLKLGLVIAILFQIGIHLLVNADSPPNLVPRYFAEISPLFVLLLSLIVIGIKDDILHE
jgi:hypothetical protein